MGEQCMVVADTSYIIGFRIQNKWIAYIFDSFFSEKKERIGVEHLMWYYLRIYACPPHQWLPTSF